MRVTTAPGTQCNTGRPHQAINMRVRSGRPWGNSRTNGANSGHMGAWGSAGVVKGKRFFLQTSGTFTPPEPSPSTRVRRPITREPQRNLSVLHVFGQTAAENPLRERPRGLIVA